MCMMPPILWTLNKFFFPQIKCCSSHPNSIFYEDSVWRCSNLFNSCQLVKNEWVYDEREFYYLTAQESGSNCNRVDCDDENYGVTILVQLN